MTKSKILSAFRKIKSILTWSAVAKLSIILCVLFLGLITWTYKEVIFTGISPGKLSVDKPPLELTKDGLAAINSLIARSELITGVSIVSVNFQQNSRRIIHFDTENLEFARLHDEYVQTHVATDQPLFNNDQENNKRIIRLINGDFICVKYVNTVSYKYAPNVKIDTVCTIGIPPYYGQFRGFIVTYLQTEPTPTEVDQVRLMVRELSAKLDNPKSK